MIDLTDDYIRHHVTIQRLSAGAARMADGKFDDLGSRLRSLFKLHGDALTAPSKSRTQALLAAVRNAIDQTYAELEDHVMSSLEEFVGYEAEFQQRLLSRKLGVNVPSLQSSTVRRIANNGRMGKHPTIGRYKAFRGQSVQTTIRDHKLRCYRRIKQQVMIAIARGFQDANS